MKRKATKRVRRLWVPIEPWYGMCWWCACRYGNVASDRCYGCGSRAPRQLRAELATLR